MLKIPLSIVLAAAAAAIFVVGVVRMTYRAWRYGHLSPLFERGSE